MSGWQTKRLADLCSIEIGRTPARDTPAYWDNEKRTQNVWVSIADMREGVRPTIESSKEHLSDAGASITPLVPAGALLVSFKLSLGKLAFAGIPLRTNEAIAALIPNEDRVLDRNFLYWYLRHFDWIKAAQGNEKVKGATLNKAKLKEILAPLPPLAEQKRIVAILDEAFEGIAKATLNAERNLANARELFDAVRKTLLSSDQIDFTLLGDACENLDSRRVPITKRDRKPGSVPYYGASGVVDQVADWIFDEDLLLVSEDGANLLMRTYPIAFSVTGKCWVNNHAHVLRFRSRARQALVEYYLNSISLEPWISGMAQPKLNQKAMNSIPVPNCSDELASNIVTTLDDLAAQTERARSAYDRQLELCLELRQSLLQRAFSGQLTGKEAIAA